MCFVRTRGDEVDPLSFSAYDRDRGQKKGFSALAVFERTRPLRAQLVSSESVMSVVSTLPTQLVSLEVTTTAFLAVLLGTFIPVFFLVTLYIQSEGYKQGSGEEY